MAKKARKGTLSLSEEFILGLYRQMYLIRMFEAQCVKLYRSGAIRGYFHPSAGQEATAVGICSALRVNDNIISTHRGHGHCIAKGAAVKNMVAELLAKETGYCGGMGGSMHIADVEKGNLGANGIVGGGLPMGVGSALAAKLRDEDRVTAIFFSDGASNNGVFAESLNLAAIWDVPAIFVIENNQYAVNIPIEQVSREPNLYKRALGYGVDGVQVDGNDVVEVYAAAKDAVEKCSNGKGPVVIECITYRHQGHHVNDPGLYMPKERLDYFKGKHDPLNIALNYCLEIVEESRVSEIEEDVKNEMKEAVSFAKKSSEPNLQDFLKKVSIQYN